MCRNIYRTSSTCKAVWVRDATSAHAPVQWQSILCPFAFHVWLHSQKHICTPETIWVTFTSAERFLFCARPTLVIACVISEHKTHMSHWKCLTDEISPDVDLKSSLISVPVIHATLAFTVLISWKSGKSSYKSLQTGHLPEEVWLPHSSQSYARTHSSPARTGWVRRSLSPPCRLLETRSRENLILNTQRQKPIKTPVPITDRIRDDVDASGLCKRSLIPVLLFWAPGFQWIL